MSSDSKVKGVLHVSKFPHGSSTPRAEKWRSWFSRVKAAFGASFPLFANQLNHTCDPHQEFWGLPFHPCHDFYNMTPVEVTNVITQFTKGQYALYHTLTENFDEKQKQVIESHAPDKLIPALMATHNWPLAHDNLEWLPFGILCAHALAKEYDESGVTDAIAKHTSFEQAKPFNPDDVDTWSSKLRHAWSAWRNAISDPSHMAAVQVLKGIIDCPETDWKSWAFQFSIAQADAPYTVEGLLDKVQQQDKLHRAGHGSKTKPAALLANGVHKPSFKKKGNGKPCRQKGCSRKVENKMFKFCNECFAARRDRAQNTAVDVPNTVRESAKNKKMQQLRTKMAQLNKQQKQAFIAELTANQHSSDEDEAPKKKKKKIKKNDSAEANIAEAVSAVPVASVMSEPATNSRTTKKKKRVKFIGPIGYKTSMALKKANSSRKVKKGKSKSTALVASSWLDGCTVQKFAGCAMPSHFARK